MINVKEKIVLVTGGYGYLGKAICDGLLMAGANVYVLGRSQKKFEMTFSKSESIIFKSCDVADSESLKKTFNDIFLQNGKIDVLINNAFYSKGNNPLNISDDEWSYSMDGVLGSVYRAIKLVVPYMIKQGYGKIINVSSMYGMVSPDFSVYQDNEEFINPPQYGAAKAGVIQLTKYFAQFLGGYNITVNAVSPGPFPNKKVQENKDFIHNLLKKMALKRIGNPEELAGAFIFLASDYSSYITGHNLVVDGGWTIN